MSRQYRDRHNSLVTDTDVHELDSMGPNSAEFFEHPAVLPLPSGQPASQNYVTPEIIVSVLPSGSLLVSCREMFIRLQPGQPFHFAKRGGVWVLEALEVRP